MSRRTPEREWRFYLDDMIGFIEKITSYTQGLDQASFVASELTYDATLHNLALLGEAATRIPDTVRQRHPEIPWRLIVATRNRLMHAYLGIDDDTIWSIVQDELPKLSNQLASIRAAQSATTDTAVARRHIRPAPDGSAGA